MTSFFSTILKNKKFSLLVTVFIFSRLASAGTLREAALAERVKGWQHNAGLGFTENKGQLADADGKPVASVLFKANVKGLDLYVTTQGLSYVFLKGGEEESEKENGREEIRPIETYLLALDIVGASIKKNNVTTEYLLEQGNQNFYLAHCPNGVLDVRTYRKITIKEIYPAIDWVIYADPMRGVKYDFIVRPGGDANRIRLRYLGAESIKLLDDARQLSVHTPFGDVLEGGLLCYENERDQTITSHYVCEKNEIRFALGEYDHSKTLVIDPPILWSTFYGGDGLDSFKGMAIDKDGNIIVVGYSSSSNFPVQAPGGPGVTVNTGNGDITVVKFSNAGVRLWATTYGGSKADQAGGVAADTAGNIFVIGLTVSLNFPVYNPGGGAFFQGTKKAGGTYESDACIMKLDKNGMRMWATYYGGTADEGIDGEKTIGPSTTILYNQTPCDITTDRAGNVYVTGMTASTDFPVFDPGGVFFQGVYGGGLFDPYILKFSNNGVRKWATYYGGNGEDAGSGIIVDTSGNIFVVGYTASTDFPLFDPGAGAYFQNLPAGAQDGFIAEFNQNLQRKWSTYYGGTTLDKAVSVVTDEAGDVYVTGYSTSPDFPLKNFYPCSYYQNVIGGGADIFLLRFDKKGVRRWATFYGGNGDEGLLFYGHSIDLTLDKRGNMYIVGGTTSNNLPIKQAVNNSAYYKGALEGANDIFIARFNPMAALEWGTYYGGPLNGLGGEFAQAVVTDSAGSIFVTGELGSGVLYNPGGGAYYQDVFGGADDALLLKLSAPTEAMRVDTYAYAVSCHGDSDGVAEVSASGGVGPYQYLWTPGGQVTRKVTGLKAGNYTVTVTDAACHSKTYTIVITEPAPVTITLTKPVPVCAGASTVITASGAPQYTYQWSTGETTPSITVAPLVTTTYTVTASDTNGCHAKDSVAVVVNPLPTVDADRDTSLCNGQSVQLHASSSGIVYYRWQPRAGLNDSTIQNPVANPITSTTYTVTVTTPAGCSARDSVRIIIRPSLDLTFTSTGVDLGTTNVDQPKQGTVVVRNNASSDARAVRIWFASAVFGTSVLTSAPQLIPANDSLAITFTVTPHTEGVSSGTLCVAIDSACVDTLCIPVTIKAVTSFCLKPHVAALNKTFPGDVVNVPIELDPSIGVKHAQRIDVAVVYDTRLLRLIGDPSSTIGSISSVKRSGDTLSFSVAPRDSLSIPTAIIAELTFEALLGPSAKGKIDVSSSSAFLQSGQQITGQGCPEEFSLDSSCIAPHTLRTKTSATIEGIYPNPTSNECHIALRIVSEQQLSVEITDVFGRRKTVVQVNAFGDERKEVIVSTEKYPNGIYFCLLKNGEQMIMKEFSVRR